MVSHTLGPLENQILKRLYSHPKQFIQQIQSALSKDYKSVHSAVKRLCQKGYVEVGDEQKTSKGNFEKRWVLSEKGIAYVLATGQADLTRCHPEYMPSELLKTIRALEPLVGKQNMHKMVSKGFKVYLSLLENGTKPAEAVNYLAGAMLGWLLTSGEVEFTPVERPEKPNMEAVKQLLKLWREFKGKIKL